MFAQKRHNPYLMRYKYSSDELVAKMQQTQAQFTASTAIIEQIKKNWEKYEQQEELSQQENHWFENIINDIQKRVESLDEARLLFREHSEKFYKKFQAIQDVQEIIVQNLVIKNSGVENLECNLSLSSRNGSNNKSNESLSSHSS